MSASDSQGGSPPKDLVAIFHASFHPTQGNTIDWSSSANENFNLDHLEFSALPSGLHLVEQDVVYFTKDGQHGVCIFKRRRTNEHGHRGFRLSSLGILLAKSTRPRPWRHVKSLTALVDSIYSKLDEREPTKQDWESARVWFNERMVQSSNLGGAGDWAGWNAEFEVPGMLPPQLDPTLHLPHLLRILGPSALTLYKHVLGRKRILIYTLPPVEAACILCHVAADMCFETQVGDGRLKGKCTEPIQVLGMVTLNDLDRMRKEGENGRGWIACTTDAIFLERPANYDMLIDLTTSTPSKATRPTLHISRPVAPVPGSRGPSHRLSTIRFAWSDVKLWNELERVLSLDADCEHGCCADAAAKSSKSITTWTDAWRVYEDVCLVCAGLWMGSWRGNSQESYHGSMEEWGRPRLEGDDDLTVGSSYVRNLGQGIEGGRSPTSSSMRRSSAMTWPAPEDQAIAKERQDKRERQMNTTLSLLQTFHANACFQLSRLDSFLPPMGGISSAPRQMIVLMPRDMLSFELGPLSGLDARYLEWLCAEYGRGHTVVVKRGWRDMVGMLIGL